MSLQYAKLTSLLNRALNQTGKQTSETEVVYICPFHHAIHNITRKKFGITLDGGAWNCFACGAKGKTFHSLLRKLKSSKKLYDELVSIVGPAKSQSKKKCAFLSPKDLVQLPNEFLSMSIPTKSIEYKNALWYLKKRGVTRDDILRYNIGYCEEGEYKNMVVIPSYDETGGLNFFQARAYYDYMPWHHKLPPASKNIIGFECFINWNEPVTIVEGAFDAASVRKNAIPLFGKLMSDYLVETLIDEEVQRVNVCLDDDALKNSIHLCEYLLRYNVGCHLIKLEGKDPSVLGFEKVNELISNSKKFEFDDLVHLKMSL